MNEEINFMINTIVRELKTYMKQNSLSQTEMAEIFGTSKFTLSRWMNGHSKISKAYKRQILLLIKREAGIFRSSEGPEMPILAKLRLLKKHTTYAKLAQQTGISECSLIRWITGRHKISPAWERVLRDRLGIKEMTLVKPPQVGSLFSEEEFTGKMTKQFKPVRVKRSRCVLQTPQDSFSEEMSAMRCRLRDMEQEIAALKEREKSFTSDSKGISTSVHSGDVLQKNMENDACGEGLRSEPSVSQAMQDISKSPQSQSSKQPREALSPARRGSLVLSSHEREVVDSLLYTQRGKGD
jgi:transcriptional regulator with XRE-family HTH domain